MANLLPGVFNGPVGLITHGQATSWEIAAIYIYALWLTYCIFANKNNFVIVSNVLLFVFPVSQ